MKKEYGQVLRGRRALKKYIVKFWGAGATHKRSRPNSGLKVRRTSPTKKKDTNGRCPTEKRTEKKRGKEGA